MRVLNGFLAATLAATTGLALADDRTAGKDGAVKLEGGYTIVAGEEGGQPLPADRVKGAVVRFTADEAIGTGPDQTQIFVAKYKLDTSRQPWRIQMTTVAPDKEKATSTTGLIKKDGDTVTIIYALPGGAEPTGFKTKEKQQMFVLKSQNKGR